MLDLIVDGINVFLGRKINIFFVVKVEGILVDLFYIMLVFYMKKVSVL